MYEKKRIISMFMILTLLLFSMTTGVFADESPTQGIMYNSTEENRSVIEDVKGDADLQVYGRVNDWYIVYNAATGNVGCMKADGIVSESAVITDKEADDLLQLSNSARADAGISPLTMDETLCSSATAKACDMVRNNYFSHCSKVLGSPFEQLKSEGAVFNIASENIAGNSSYEGAFQCWMDSESQRTNILNGNYTKTGIGVCSSPVYGQVFVQLFSD